MSGLVLSVSPPAPANRSEDIDGLLPVRPTARRTFSAGDRVVAFARIYQPSAEPKPIHILATIVDANNKEVLRRSIEVPSSAFSKGSADVSIELPSELPTGQYLFAVEAPGLKSLRRTVRLTR